MVVISFYSDPPGQTVYANFAPAMAARLRELGHRCDLRQIPYQGSWRGMCLAKPAFIESMLDLHAEPVVWTDIDNHVLKPIPPLDPATYDVAAPRGNDHDTGLMVLTHEGAVLCVNHTPGAREFLRRWRQRCETSTDQVTDHYHLLHVWRQAQQEGDIRLLTLPGHFCTRQPDAETIVHLRKVMYRQKAVEFEAIRQYHRRGSGAGPDVG